LTPDGEAIMNAADADEALKRVRAATQLNIELHPRLQAAGVHTTFRGGDLDSAGVVEFKPGRKGRIVSVLEGWLEPLRRRATVKAAR
jgi:hypothetical protein